MKIENSIGSLGSISGSSSKAKSTGTPSASSAAPAGAKVQISTRFQEIEAAMGNSPVVNSERVAEIKQAIAEGRFQVNAERVADGLIASVKDMLSRATR
jgi:negative regulator of flagellin synthesis FlgM